MKTIQLVGPALRDIVASMKPLDPEHEPLDAFRAQMSAAYAQIAPAMPGARRRVVQLQRCVQLGSSRTSVIEVAVTPIEPPLSASGKPLTPAPAPPATPGSTESPPPPSSPCTPATTARS